ncbi:MAG: hypothetical protein QOE45_668 [Frankiaceae bacterium]|nr:hypothetical protein [Frankiaceae bacterium]
MRSNTAAVFVTEPNALWGGQAELVGLLDAGEPVERTLDRVTRLVATTVPGCHAASIALWDGARPFTVASTTPLARDLDEAQYRADEGPCLDASREGTPCLVVDMATESRWPAFAPIARAYGVFSALCVPITVRGRPRGTLNMQALVRDAFGDAGYLAGEYAAQAAGALVNAEIFQAGRDLADRLDETLLAHTNLERAKGVLMARQGILADAAAEVLDRLAAQEGVSVRDVAARLANERSRTT